MSQYSANRAVGAAPPTPRTDHFLTGVGPPVRPGGYRNYAYSRRYWQRVDGLAAAIADPAIVTTPAIIRREALSIAHQQDTIVDGVLRHVRRILELEHGRESRRERRRWQGEAREGRQSA